MPGFASPRLALVVLVAVALVAYAGPSRAGVVVELVADILAGPGSSNPAEFANSGNGLLFSAGDPASGIELWKTDGTSAGTTLVRDIYAGFMPSDPGQLTPLGGGSVFTALTPSNGVELWKSDGTPAGTQLVRDIAPGESGSYPFNFASLGSEVLFSADDGTHGIELWKTDGTAAGTTLVADIATGDAAVGAADSYPGNFAELGGALYFSAMDAAHGMELWKTDGTTAGTTLVADIATGDPALGYESSFPENLTVFDGSLYFSAFDPDYGIELWKSDGTAAGTALVADIVTGVPGLDSSYPQHLTAFGGALYFSAFDLVHGVELWKTDGTTAGTTLVKDIAPGVGDSTPGGFTAFGDALFFSAHDPANGTELWKTDGTEGGTVLVKDIREGTGGSLPGDFTAFGGELYFAATDGVSGVELWRTDGTAGGTTLVEDIFAGAGDSFPSDLTPFGGDLLFSATDEAHGRELWRMRIMGDTAVPEPSTFTLAALALAAGACRRRRRTTH